MADERDDAQKTEDPTDKRRADAKKKGDIAKSQEVPTFFILGAAALAVWLVIGPMATSLATDLRPFLARGHEIALDQGAILRLFRSVLWITFGALVIPLSMFMLAGVAGNVVQSMPVFTFEKIKPSLQKISPLAGLKKLFGLQGLVNFTKGVAKLSFVAAVIIAIVYPQRGMLVELMQTGPLTALVTVKGLAITIIVTVVMIVAVISVFDFMFQKYEHTKRLKMTKQEIKDEHKQSEGDPLVKQRLRQVRMERAKGRMMAAVPEASVVIMNPTHYAIALQYESGTLGAPVCVAKGVDHLALTIREVAEEHGVPVVENAPLARALYATVEIDGEVPPEHYKAVAQVIGYVMQLKKRYH